MKLSYSAIWDDAARMLAANSSLLLAIAGVFLFFPSLLLGYFGHPPRAITVDALSDYYSQNILWILLAYGLNFIGSLALLVLALDDARPTVGGAITAAVRLLPVYLVAAILSGFILFVGFMFFIVPGLYLAARLALVGPVVVSERGRSPVDVIRRSFELTKGHGWAILGMMAIIYFVFYIVSSAIEYAIGSILILMDKTSGGSLGQLLLSIIIAAATAAFNTVLVVVLSTIYRQLAPSRLAQRTSGI